MLEQELASIMHAVLALCPEAKPYYWEVPQDFFVPSVYFPVPEIESSGDTLSTFRLSYTWYIKFFASTTMESHAMALRVLSAIREHRNAIALVNEDGSPEGHIFRLLDPTVRNIERGVTQMSIRWRSPRPYYAEVEPTVNNVRLHLTYKTRRELDEVIARLTEARVKGGETDGKGRQEAEGGGAGTCDVGAHAREAGADAAADAAGRERAEV